MGTGMKNKVIFVGLLVVLIILFGADWTPRFHLQRGGQNPAH